MEVKQLLGPQHLSAGNLHAALTLQAITDCNKWRFYMHHNYLKACFLPTACVLLFIKSALITIYDRLMVLSSTSLYIIHTSLWQPLTGCKMH